MSKLFKFIVHLAFVGAALCSLAMLVPQLLGIKTTIIDENTYTETNMLKGCVTYSMAVEPDQLGMRDEIVVENGKTVNRYTVVNVEIDKQECAVKRSTKESFENNTNPVETISIKNGAYKYLFCIEYIGYLLIATQSRQGWIILGITIAVLFILYIISEIWKKTPEKEKGRSEKKSDRKAERRPEKAPAKRKDDDEEVIKTPKELKREEKRREKLRREEEKIMLEEERERKKAAKRKKKMKNTVRTGGFVDEIDEEDEYYVPEDIEVVEQPSAEQRKATSEAHEELRKEIAAVTANAMQERQELESRFASAASTKNLDLSKPAAEETIVQEAETVLKEAEEAIAEAFETAPVEKKTESLDESFKDFLEEVEFEEDPDFASNNVKYDSILEEETEESSEDVQEENVEETPVAALEEEIEEETEENVEKETEEIEEEEEIAEPEADEKSLFPNHTIEDLVNKARANGEMPDIMRDEVSQVVLFDYSDIITEEE